MTTIALLPTEASPPVSDWAHDMAALGYDVTARELADGRYVNEARPRVETNANTLRRPRRRQQFGHSALPSGGPDGDSAA